MKRVASMPSSSGIWMSITTTSGCVSSTTCSASRPSAADPSTSMPGSGTEQGDQAVPHDLVVVDHDDADLGHDVSS